MKSLSKKQLIIIPAILILILLIFIAYRLSLSFGEKDFAESLKTADTLISNKQWEDAAGRLTAISMQNISAGQFVRLLKRVRQVSIAAGQKSLYLTVGKTAIDNYPGHIILLALRLDSLLLNGQHESAADLAADNLTDAIDSPHLLRMIFLALSQRPSDLARFTDAQIALLPRRMQWTYLLRLADSAARFFEIARQMNSPSLVLDAALLYMKEGNREEAARIASTIVDSYPRAAMLLLYDSDDYIAAEKAWLALSSSDQMIYVDDYLLAGDIFLRRGEYNRAAQIYRRLIADYSDFSSLPYRNLFMITRTLGNPSLTPIRSGVDALGDNVDFLLLQALYYLDRKEMEQTRKIIEQGMENYPDSVAFNLFFIYLFSLNRSPTHIMTRLWQLYLANPDNQALFDYFIRFALSISDYGAVDKIISQARKNDLLNKASVDYFQAVNLALQGNLVNASVMIDRAIKASATDHFGWHNGAVIHLALDNNEQALHYLKMANAFCAGSPQWNRSTLHASLRVLMAQAYYQTGDSRAALLELQLALEMEPANISGLLLQKQIQLN